MSSKLFLEKLTQIGYPGIENLDNYNIDILFCNKKLAPFLTWICNNVHKENIVRSDEITRYNVIEASGKKILNIQQLKELDALPEKDDVETQEILQTEVRKLEWKLENYDKQIQILTLRKQKMSSKCDSLSKHIETSKLDVDDAKRQLESSKNICNNDNISMNETVDSLDAKLEKIFEHLEKFSHSKKGWISVLDLDPFRLSSKNSIEDTIASLRKRFAEKGLNSEELYERNNKEYQLLRQGLSNNKMRFLKGEVCRKGTESALIAGQSIVNSMNLSTFRSTSEVLSSKLSDANRTIETLNIEYNSLFAVVSSKVIKEADESAMLLVSTLHNSKLKRLQNSIAMFDKVLFNLCGHLSRAKFILVAIEIEKQYLEHIADSVGVIEKMIQEERKLFEDKKKFVTDLKSSLIERKQFSPESQTATFDIINILGIDNQTLLSGDEFDVARQELVKLEEKYNSLHETLQLNFKLEKIFLRKMDRSLLSLHESIWSECATRNEVPTITPRAVIDSLKKVESNFNIIQNILFETMENYHIKEKDLHSDICLLHKRTLYVYFYTSPESLRRAVQIIRSKQNNSTSI